MPKSIVKTIKCSPILLGAADSSDRLGRIGITPCPGQDRLGAAAGAWNGALGRDLDEVARWGATALVSLDTEREIASLSLSGLAEAVRNRHMEWWHLPVPGNSVPGPDFEAAWIDVGAAIRDRLRLGFDVAIHSRSGLGRAATVAARLLVELGANPADAIREVRAATSRQAISAPAQEQHVEACAAPERILPAQSEEAIRDRALGAFVGLAAGDALGMPFEGKWRDTEPLLDDLIDGGPFRLPAGCWTDDTAMAWALASSLADEPGLDRKDLMDRFLAWWLRGEYSSTGRCYGMGRTVRASLERYRRTGNSISGSTDPLTAGNGSLMRLSPVALRFWNDRAELDRVAAQQSRTTHGALEAVDACRAFAAMLADAIEGAPRRAVLAPRSFDGASKISKILGGSWQGRRRSTIETSAYVVDTLEAAIWSVARTGSFRNAVVLAVNLARDADTVAAVAGQLAGALYGLSGIPQRWLERIALKDSLVSTAERLLEPVLGVPSESR